MNEVIVSNVHVYGLEESVVASGYPMATDVENATCNFERAHKLAETPMGAGHDNFLQGIIVQFDLRATNKFWTEMQRYHFIDFVSSQSTMHRLAKFDFDNAYNEYVDKNIIARMKELQEDYLANPTLDKLYGLLYSNPAGFELTARMTTNYRQLRTIYNQRKNHRLVEWRDFCKWIEVLPSSNLILGSVPNA